MSQKNPKPLVIVTGPKKGFISRYFIKFCIFLSGGKSKIITENSKFKNLEMDALLISGGDDLYNAFIDKDTCEIDDIITYERDVLEYKLLYKAIEENKPVFGICRGYQLINVYFGGDLYEDIRNDGYDYRYTPFAWKNIFLKKGRQLNFLTKQREIKINTLHHQAVKTVPKNFKIEAIDKDNIIQSISMKTKKNLIFGVQWHPEYLFFMKSHLKLFKMLVNSAIETKV
ncbi:MAG: gamma-glutamyl-gamma-aminobutyrate hydrolase family protein [Halarcobacter sp.]